MTTKTQLCARLLLGTFVDSKMLLTMTTYAKAQQASREQLKERKFSHVTAI